MKQDNWGMNMADISLENEFQNKIDEETNVFETLILKVSNF